MQKARTDDKLFLRLTRDYPDMRLERSGGEIIMMSPAGAESGEREARLVHLLMTWNEARGRPGRVFGPSTGFRLPNGDILAPDASWVEKGRWEALTPKQRRGFAPICPDFVAELKSPTDRRRKLRAKMREYMACGARLGWLIDPKRRTVEAYRPGEDPVVGDEDTTTGMSGMDVLPEFTLWFSDIFDED